MRTLAEEVVELLLAVALKLVQGQVVLEERDDVLAQHRRVRLGNRLEAANHPPREDSLDGGAVQRHRRSRHGCCWRGDVRVRSTQITLL